MTNLATPISIGPLGLGIPCGQNQKNDDDPFARSAKRVILTKGSQWAIGGFHTAVIHMPKTVKMSGRCQKKKSGPYWTPPTLNIRPVPILAVEFCGRDFRHRARCVW